MLNCKNSRAALFFFFFFFCELCVDSERPFQFPQLLCGIKSCSSGASVATAHSCTAYSPHSLWPASEHAPPVRVFHFLREARAQSPCLLPSSRARSFPRGARVHALGVLSQRKRLALSIFAPRADSAAPASISLHNPSIPHPSTHARLETQKHDALCLLRVAVHPAYLH